MIKRNPLRFYYRLALFLARDHCRHGLLLWSVIDVLFGESASVSFCSRFSQRQRLNSEPAGVRGGTKGGPHDGVREEADDGLRCPEVPRVLTHDTFEYINFYSFHLSVSFVLYYGYTNSLVWNTLTPTYMDICPVSAGRTCVWGVKHLG